MISNSIWHYVRDVDARGDQVWFRLACVPDWKFGACYVPPADSPYFSPQCFGDIQEQLFLNDKIFLIGDLNSRMSNLSMFDDVDRGIVYADNVDKGSNAHGKELANICKWSEVYPVNNVTLNGKQFSGNLTFRKRTEWISQLDWCICSFDVLQCIRDFAVLSSSPLLGDHATLSVAIDVPGPGIDITRDRSRLLQSCPDPQLNLARRPIAFCSISKDIYQDGSLPDVEEWWSEQENRLEQWAPGQAEEALSDFCDSVTETIYRACQRARQRVPREDVGENQMAISATSHSRWRKLLSLRDPKAIWQAINWRGEFEFPGYNESPSDSEFVSHFERLLGPTESREDIDPPIVNMYVRTAA